jgi:AcrR family transcriptional regulator
MVGKVAQRREARTAEIVAAAWELAEVEGIAGFSLHGLARELGIRQPSLYEYFDSKLALYDAMFADGNAALLARLERTTLPADPRRAIKAFMHVFVEFALALPARTELLFTRTIPGFEPSPEAYAPAIEVLDRAGVLLRAAGMPAPGDIDCFVAMIGGLITAQLSNEPGGKRWVRHLDRLIDLYLDHLPNRRSR